MLLFVETISPPISSFRACVVSLSIALACSPSGWSEVDVDASASTGGAPVELETLFVTGSNIPEDADALPTPVVTLGSIDFERTGIATNLLEILQKRLPMVAGNNNLGTTNAGANVPATGGGSQLALRNLSTLVLLNGRRVSDNGLGGRGGRSFVDISQIPVAAIARIEVLADGASAIYGSDAIGGVVNVILRSDFEGTELGSRYAFSSGDTEYAERSAHAVTGMGNDRFRVTLAASWSKTDPLFQSDRAYSSPMRGLSATISGAVGQGPSFPTHLLDPALNSPRERNPTGTAAVAPNLAALVANDTYVPATTAAVAASVDLAPYVTLLLGRESRSGYASFDAKIGSKQLEVFGDFMVTESDSFSQVAAQFTLPNVTAPAGSPFNPLTTAFPQIAFRYLPAPRSIDLEGRLLRTSVGVRGEFNREWKWQTGVTHSRNDSALHVHNALYAPNIVRAISGGYDAQGRVLAGGAYSRVLTGFSEASTTWAIQPALDPFARAAGIVPASLEHVLGTVAAEFDATLTQYDATLTGAAIELPAGKLRFALGGDVRRETLSGQPDENLRNTGPTARRWIGAPYFDPFDRSRDVHAAFGEVRVPIAGPAWRIPGFHALELNVAGRVEEYSDTPRSSVPKYSVRWQPESDRLTLRYSFSKSFQAPSLYSLYGPFTQGLTASTVIPSVFGVNGTAVQQTGSNADLSPTKADTHSVGFVWALRAVTGLTAAVDFVSVHQTDVTGTLGAAAILQDVDQRGAESPYAGQVALLRFPGIAGAVPISTPGQLTHWLVTQGNSANSVFVVDMQRNLASQKIRALDARIDYRVPGDSSGVWSFQSVGTFWLANEFKADPLQSYYEYAGFATRGGTGSQGTIPRYRLYTTADWSRGGWSAVVAHTYVSSVVDIATGGATFQAALAAGTRKRVPVDAWSSVDVSVSYTVKGGFARRGPSWLHGMKLTAGVNNLANRQPPTARQAFDDNNTDIATYDPIGRLWFVSATAKF